MEIQVQQVLLQALNFGLLLFVMAKFLYKPILKILDERANKINEGLQAAEKSLTERSKLEEIKQEELTKAQKQASEILEEATQQARGLQKEIVAEARKEAQSTIKKQEEELKIRFAHEENKLKGKVSQLVVAATKSVLKDSLSSTQHKEIVKTQIGRLKNVKTK